MVFVPGNHDEFARQFVGLTFGGIEIVATPCTRPPTASTISSCTAMSSTSSCATRSGSPSSATGPTTRRCSSTRISTVVRRLLGFGYWSFSAWAKLKVKNAVNFIGDFEQNSGGRSGRRGVDGVICGHIHHATIRDIDGVLYVNIGDFVESLLGDRRTRRTEDSKSCIGGRTAEERAPAKAEPSRSRKKPPPDAYFDCDGRMASASERRRAFARAMSPARPAPWARNSIS